MRAHSLFGLSPVLVLLTGLGGAGFVLASCDSEGADGPGTAGSGSGGAGSSSGGSTGSGGASTGGSTSSGGAGGEGSTDQRTPRPSAGCGKADPQTGARSLEIEGEDGAFLVSIPSSYDPAKPYPLGFAFHGHGRTHTDCRSGDCKGFQSVLGEEAILVYMKSFGPGWEQNEVRDQNAAFFEATLDLVEEEFCVDERRVFVAGTSSGASFSNVLACRYGDRLLAVGPVAGWLPERQNCRGEVAAVVIHGIDDPHVTFDAGETARDFYLERNGCSSSTVPELAEMHATIRASRDANQTNQACVDYQGCNSGLPVRWCEHSEGGYDDSTHGWPTAGGQLIWDFVKEL